MKRTRLSEHHREHRRRRMRRHGRRAYIRSVYFLPSLATLGNSVCGFAACYVAAFDINTVGRDPVAIWLEHYKFLAAAYFILLAMVFDALDGRLARFTRHTTDFGGQLDSLADVVSFGFAPAFVALLVFKEEVQSLPFWLTRLVWALGAVYFACASIRLARFNVSNEHGEQHHFSFLGLPSPGAAGAVVGVILMQRELLELDLDWAAKVCAVLLPVVVLITGLLMVSGFRYPHLFNRYLRGRRSIARLLAIFGLVLFFFVAHRFAIGLWTLGYAAWGPVNWAWLKWRPRHEATGLEPLPQSVPGP